MTKEPRKTHVKGLLGELAFAFHLVENGWKIFTPLDQNSRIDMIAEKNGKFTRIQVKYCTPYKGCLRVDLEHRLRHTKPFDPSELDAVGVFDSISSRFYLIPFEKISPHKGIWLRLEKSANSQEEGIRWAKDFEI